MLPVKPTDATITFVRDLPAPVGAHVLTRTNPAIEALASYALDAALDPLLAAEFRPARRSGVMRTSAVTDTTTLLVTRMRFHANLPGRDRDVPMVVEEAHLAAFTGTPDNPTWLTTKQWRPPKSHPAGKHARVDGQGVPHPGARSPQAPYRAPVRGSR